MIRFSKVSIAAKYDSGTFMHFLITKSKPESYSSLHNNIQSAYNLKDEDFIALEVIIGNEVNKYIKGKE